MKLTEFFRRWKEGMDTLPPSKLLKSKRIGIIGTIAGMTIGFGVMTFRGAWYFLFLWFFICWLQGTELISTNQQLKNAIKHEKIMEEQK